MSIESDDFPTDEWDDEEMRRWRGLELDRCTKIEKIERGDSGRAAGPMAHWTSIEDPVEREIIREKCDRIRIDEYRDGYSKPSKEGDVPSLKEKIDRWYDALPLPDPSKDKIEAAIRDLRNQKDMLEFHSREYSLRRRTIERVDERLSELEAERLLYEEQLSAFLEEASIRYAKSVSEMQDRGFKADNI